MDAVFSWRMQRGGAEVGLLDLCGAAVPPALLHPPTLGRCLSAHNSQPGILNFFFLKVAGGVNLNCELN